MKMMKMNRKPKLFELLFVVAMISVASAATKPPGVGLPVLPAVDGAKPNILLILVDDMGYSDLSCFGSEIKMPNLDRLAADGIKFTDFTNCAKCECSRAALMTGRYHVENGVSDGKTVITIPCRLLSQRC